MTDREQIRLDAEAWLAEPTLGGAASMFARHCLALLAELGQVNARIDSIWALRSEPPNATTCAAMVNQALQARIETGRHKAA